MLESRDELITAILGKQLSRSPSHEAIDSQTLWAGCHVSRSMTEARGLVAAQHSSYRRISKCDTPRVAIHVDASSVYYARRVAAAVAVRTNPRPGSKAHGRWRRRGGGGIPLRGGCYPLTQETSPTTEHGRIEFRQSGERVLLERREEKMREDMEREERERKKKKENGARTVEGCTALDYTTAGTHCSRTRNPAAVNAIVGGQENRKGLLVEVEILVGLRIVIRWSRAAWDLHLHLHCICSALLCISAPVVVPGFTPILLLLLFLLCLGCLLFLSLSFISSASSSSSSSTFSIHPISSFPLPLLSSSTGAADDILAAQYRDFSPLPSHHSSLCTSSHTETLTSSRVSPALRLHRFRPQPFFCRLSLFIPLTDTPSPQKSSFHFIISCQPPTSARHLAFLRPDP
ncbi:hypothetical protein LIA77_07756 [Sarocladium implicatum]|nr:hypothetical protein LIA77_07756 [Sarocladium implicatum]